MVACIEGAGLVRIKCVVIGWRVEACPIRINTARARQAWQSLVGLGVNRDREALLDEGVGRAQERVLIRRRAGASGTEGLHKERPHAILCLA